MNLFEFLKEKIMYIISQVFISIFIIFLFKMLKIDDFASIIIVTLIIIMTTLSLLLEYYKKRNYYNNVYKALEQMDKKYYISQVIENADFVDGKILKDIINQTTRSMNNEIARYKIIQEEYQEYIETWIHEIKIPISCIQLICENNKTEINKNINEETEKIESYVEQALYYAKSTNMEIDYKIRNINLKSIVQEVIKKYSMPLIENKTEIELKNLDYEVYADSKWMNFILGQVISNSIKYKKEKLTISIFAKENNNQIILYIKDNGIGICEKDLPRVLEKGFTGENGRKFAKSTGIGLYLCKTLCEKMYLGFSVDSKVNEFTIVKIIFPKDKNELIK